MADSDNTSDPMSLVKHDRTSYVYRRCRCDVCRAANAQYIRGWRAKQTPGKTPVPPAPAPTTLTPLEQARLARQARYNPPTAPTTP